MPMNEELLKVELSPGEGRPYGWFKEGMPIAEGIGLIMALQIDGKDGARLRRYGRVMGVEDRLLNINNTQGGTEQVVSTQIIFDGGDDLLIRWAETAVAVAEIALTQEE